MVEISALSAASTGASIYPPQKFLDKYPGRPHLSSPDAFSSYKQLYQHSIEDPSAFWRTQASELLSWSKDFTTVQSGSLQNGDVAWFLDGELNASYNCIDRHSRVTPEKPALICEADDVNEGRVISYSELLRQVSQLSYALKNRGVKKGDVVTIYMPMIPEASIAMLACARIGAIHSVVFAGFSADALRDRIIDAKSRILLTVNEGKRGGKTLKVKDIVDKALRDCPGVSTALVYRRTNAEPETWMQGRDIWWQEEVKRWPAYIPAAPMSAEDPLFLLYTSGSTGKPKGVLHTTGGYLVGAALTGKHVFDIHSSDRFFCAGDVGWITGHTYIVYAPLLLGATTVIFEGTPAYPTYSRYWNIVTDYKITQFYVAPTALRLLKRAGDEYVVIDRRHLRVLGSVGEPIAPEIWKWYHNVVGNGEAQVVDTYWQTETGSHVITPLAGVTPTKPGSASFPFFGISPALLDPQTGKEIDRADIDGVLVFKEAWPSMARTVWGAHDRYMDTYLNPFKGYYYTGDSASRDQDGLYWIKGRMDDIINVSGHRISTAEVEAALLADATVSEAAVIGIPDDLTGQASAAFLTLNNGVEVEASTHAKLSAQVRTAIGPFAAPKKIFIIPDQPKTRSGKIMRRLLRKIASGESDQLGDVSTLSDPSVVERIIEIVKNGPV